MGSRGFDGVAGLAAELHLVEDDRRDAARGAGFDEVGHHIVEGDVEDDPYHQHHSWIVQVAKSLMKSEHHDSCMVSNSEDDREEQHVQRQREDGT